MEKKMSHKTTSKSALFLNVCSWLTPNSRQFFTRFPSPFSLLLAEHAEKTHRFFFLAPFEPQLNGLVPFSRADLLRLWPKLFPETFKMNLPHFTGSIFLCYNQRSKQTFLYNIKVTYSWVPLLENIHFYRCAARLSIVMSA